MSTDPKFGQVLFWNDWGASCEERNSKYLIVLNLKSELKMLPSIGLEELRVLQKIKSFGIESERIVIENEDLRAVTPKIR